MQSPPAKEPDAGAQRQTGVGNRILKKPRVVGYVVCVFALGVLQPAAGAFSKKT